MTQHQIADFPMSSWRDAETVVGLIEAAQEPPWREHFSPSRWPYTYAYDYMRQHGIARSAGRSRAQCAGLLRDNPDKEHIVAIFALAYCRENDITVPVNADA